MLSEIGCTKSVVGPLGKHCGRRLSSSMSRFVCLAMWPLSSIMRSPRSNAPRESGRQHSTPEGQTANYSQANFTVILTVSCQRFTLSNFAIFVFLFSFLGFQSQRRAGFVCVCSLCVQLIEPTKISATITLSNGT